MNRGVTCTLVAELSRSWRECCCLSFGCKHQSPTKNKSCLIPCLVARKVICRNRTQRDTQAHVSWSYGNKPLLCRDRQRRAQSSTPAAAPMASTPKTNTPCDSWELFAIARGPLELKNSGASPFSGRMSTVMY